MGDPLGDVLYHRQILTFGLGLSLLGFRKGFRKMMEPRQEEMKVKKTKRDHGKAMFTLPRYCLVLAQVPAAVQRVGIEVGMGLIQPGDRADPAGVNSTPSWALQ